MSAYPVLATELTRAAARPLPVAPYSSTTALPASLVETPGGGARVTIGSITCPYASAALARTHLAAMAARGVVQLPATLNPA